MFMFCFFKFPHEKESGQENWAYKGTGKWQIILETLLFINNFLKAAQTT